MIDALFNQPNYVAVKKMLDATAMRHEAIASNLANLETPNYKRIDLSPSFDTELQNAIGSQDPQKLVQMQPTLTVDATAIASSRDGNTVQLETELVHLNENTMAHTLQTQLVSGSLMRLRLAITGRSS